MKTLTLSILQFNSFVKNILDAEEFLSNISVFGEVTNFKISGGNAYFDLKDSNAMLSCIKFGADDLNINNGDKITVFGKVNFYVKTGKLSFVVSKTQAYGMGELYQKFLELKNRLESEGLFREEIKKPIPKYSKRIGVVTSETGAVIRDIINVTKSKNKHTEIIVFPSKVQGFGAEDELASGIEYFNSRDDIDVIIVARGGGSLEDLAPFNTEKIVKAIYQSKIPIISGVGHETDFTLCDFASDLRVPTPSVAAEVAVFDYNYEVERVIATAQNIFDSITSKVDYFKEELITSSKLMASEMKLRTIQTKSNITHTIKDIEKSIHDKTSKTKSDFEKLFTLISKLNPLEILRNGYSVLQKGSKRVSKLDMIAVGDNVDIILGDGKAEAKILSKEKKHDI